MFRYLVRRTLMALITIAAISVLSFMIIQLPRGDYINSYVAQQTASGTEISLQEAENLRKQ